MKTMLLEDFARIMGVFEGGARLQFHYFIKAVHGPIGAIEACQLLIGCRGNHQGRGQGQVDQVVGRAYTFISSLECND